MRGWWPCGLTLIRAVRWFDAPAARMRGPADVWLFDGRIGAVVAPGTLQARPDRVVEGAGRTLLPGLWDMHAHMWPGSGLMHLAAGVTSVRDPANQNADILRLQSRTARGEVAGPAIHVAGFIEGKSPFSARNGFVVDTLQAGLDAVDWYAVRGMRSIKLYNSIKPEWVRPLAARAKAQGLRVTGHIPAFMRAETAVRDGYDEITHINQVMLNFVMRPGDDSRTLVRFERVGSDAHALDMKSAKARAFIALLRQRRTTVDPTLGTFEGMFTQAQGQPNPGLHRELALYVQAGIPAAEALRIATWNGALYAGDSAARGRIERGFAADLVLVDGDPSVNITDLRRASLVIQGRVAYAPAQLYESLGFKPFVPGARFETPAP
jgi:Amidohydrolase family